MLLKTNHLIIVKSYASEIKPRNLKVFKYLILFSFFFFDRFNFVNSNIYGVVYNKWRGGWLPLFVEGGSHNCQLVHSSPHKLKGEPLMVQFLVSATSAFTYL